MSQNHKLTKDQNIQIPVQSGIASLQQLHSSKNTIKEVIEKYKSRLREKGIGTEIYKYKLIKTFQEQWDIDAPDFASMIKGIDYRNLVFHNALGALNETVIKHPEPVRETFRFLYDEAKPLQTRISGFLKKIASIHDLVKKDPNHRSWHDERSVATYLAFRYPDKYFIYKDSFYGPLCDLLGTKKAPAGSKYVHYLELATRIKDQFVLEDSELLKLVDNQKDNTCYSDPNRTVLTQDILYTMLDRDLSADQDKDASDNLKTQLLKRLAQIGNRKPLDIYFKHLQRLFTSLYIDEEDERLYCTFPKSSRRITFTFGQRYIHKLEKSGDYFRFGFITTVKDAKKYLKSQGFTKGEFGGAHPMMFVDINLSEEEVSSFDFESLLQDCISGLRQEKDRDFNYSFKKGNNKEAHNPLIYRMAMDEEFRNEMIAKALKEPILPSTKTNPKPMSPNDNKAKNTILYGPPGTGKTYATIDYAVEIANQDYGSHAANKQRFDVLRKQGEIEFITFHQNYAYEDFVVGMRPVESAGTLAFKKHEGIFYELCKRAEANYLNHKTGTKLDNFEADFEAFIKPLSEGKEIEVRLVSGEGSFYLYDINETTIRFRKQNGSTLHTLSIATLKDLYNSTRSFSSGLQYYYNAILRSMRAKAPKQPSEPLKNYILIIDEINRANISKVFGELITLLEEDKRIDGANELRVSLPNGEKQFGVPPNLYIIGTMNTADKSIAHIDIALRRRFEFIGKYPETQHLSPLFAKVLTGLNSAIMEYKKSPDFLIGHGYFIGRPDSELKLILSNKVLPLLNEYFIGRTDIIKEVLKSADINYTENTVTKLLEIA
jgi:hypothetical protein